MPNIQSFNSKSWSKIFFTVIFAVIPTVIFSQEYKLVWQDDFNKPSIDTTTWSARETGDGGGNREIQFYHGANLSIGKEPVTNESCLIVTAKKEEFNGKPCTSGRVSTKGKMTFKYGKVVARIKMPKTANGLWPAFWMLGFDHNSEVNNWPKCGEIDIVEMGKNTGIEQGVQDRYFNGACHWGESWNNGNWSHIGVSCANDYSLQDTFHTYTLFWTPDSIKMYLDFEKFPTKKLYFSMALTGTEQPNEPSRYFRKPFYLIFNVAVGGTFSEIYDINKITALNDGDANMYVDYVRVYQTGNGSEEFYRK